MPALPLTLHLVTQHLAGGVLLAEPLLFPEVQVCHDRPDKLHGLARALAAEVAGRSVGAEWHRRAVDPPPRPGTVRLTVDPPRHQAAWTEPLDCAVDYVWWPHGDQAVVGYFPALGIEVIARNPPDLEARAPDHLRAAVRRLMGARPAKDDDPARRPGRPRPAVGSLFRLALLRRVERVELSATELVVELPSPKRRQADADAAADKPKAPLIEQVGRVLSADGADLEPAYEVDALVARVAEALGGRPPRPVLLVGPAGVGKTAVVRELVRRRDTIGLAGVPVWQTSGARLVAGQTGFGMWQERCANLCREAAAARAVVHLGNLFELVEVGQAEGSGQGVGGFLKPYLLRGDLLAVAECTPEQLTRVERLDPHLVEAFAVVRAEEPAAGAAARIVARRAADLGHNLVHLTPAGLAAVMRLHKRYAGYSALPARPLGFVANLVRDALAAHPDGFPGGRHEVGPADVTAAFARQTGLPRFLLDDAVPLDLPTARAALAGRVIGQPAAVDLLADLIATVKAGLSRPRRPVASLLFIGPTGVGKTEMAKALAAFFFGSADRMTRFDMSEFGTAHDVQRLVGGVPGGAAVRGGGGSDRGRCAPAEGLLTAKVREQPFSVVLLDEVEKAHPLLFDLLLQALGEGRLTDAAGRVADFTNAVVVMTSNLGADRFGQAGFGLREAAGGGTGDAAAHFTEAVRDFLRPELFNRIDRIVPFLPLGPAAVERIVRRELDLVAARDGVRLRGVAFAPDDEVVRHLAARGYDRAYGARPLKRTIERELLVPLADGVNGYAADQPLAAEVTVRNGRLAVTVRAAGDAAGGPTARTAAGSRWADAAAGAADLRRAAQRLQRTTALLGAQNELFALRRADAMLAERARRRGEVPPYDAVRAKRTARLAAVVDGSAALLAEAIDLEDAALDGAYAGVGSGSANDVAAVVVAGADGVPPAPPAPPTPAAIAAGRDRLAAGLDDLLLDLHDLRYADPDRITLVFLANRHALAVEMARAYAAAAGPAAEVTGWWHGQDAKGERTTTDPLRPAALLPPPPEPRAERLVVRVVVRHAAARFSPETGLHVFATDNGNQTEDVFVHAVQTDPAAYAAPAELTADDPTPLRRRRRTYFMDRAVAKDERTPAELRWGGRGFADAVAEGMRLATAAVVAAVLDGKGGDGNDVATGDGGDAGTA